MSDSPEEFERNVMEMLDLAVGQIDLIGKIFTSKIVFKVVIETPGPNNQLPDTEYYATGRLRGAYTMGSDEVATASRWDGGPYDEDGLGESVHSRLDAEIMGEPMKAEYFLNNDVAYGYIVHYGGGRMPYPRPYRDLAVTEGAQFIALREATSEAMAA